MTMNQPQGAFRFRKNEPIGEPAAELDDRFLMDCFEDTGDLSHLKETDRPRSIVLGRTGSGKTALLIKVTDGQTTSTENAAWIKLEDLALQYLSGCTILKFLDQLDVNLDKFFKLLWRHIIVIELVKLKWPVQNEQDKKTFIERIMNLFSNDKKKEKSLKYFIDWSGSFFETTEYRIKELTNKLESSVEAKFGAKVSSLEANLGGKEAISAEEKMELVSRAQKVVNDIQIAQLNEVFEILAEDVFPTPQPPYYVLIDRLDESWVDDTVRYRLIRDLIETVKEFARVPGVKVIVALRQDLIDRVFLQTRDPGTQREKFESLFLRLEWTEGHLLGVLDKRVNQLVRRRYTGGSVGWKDLLPSHIDGQNTGAYLIERTLYRPRDLIVFFNKCIEKADGESRITQSTLKAAESEYSQARIEALYDEWDADYPDLSGFVKLLKSKPPTFRFGAITPAEVEAYCLEYSVGEVARPADLSKLARTVAEGELAPLHFMRRAVSIFYRVGLVGLKIDRSEPVHWSFRRGAAIQQSDISDDTSISICPAFYRCLTVNDRRKK